MEKRSLSSKQKQSIIKTVQDKVGSISKRDVERMINVVISVGTGVVAIAKIISDTIGVSDQNGATATPKKERQSKSVSIKGIKKRTAAK
jgi:hypothetical protein